MMARCARVSFVLFVVAEGPYPRGAMVLARRRRMPESQRS